MECYEGATMIKTYKGILADGGQDHIRLKTLKGEIGYRVVKFQGIGDNPGGQNSESLLKIYKVEQTAVTGTIDFSDNTLLGIVYWQGGATAGDTPQDMIIIFDSEIFNQDIYITHHEAHGSQKCNYYIELEQVMLNENESTMATLQSLRTVAEN